MFVSTEAATTVMQKNFILIQKQVYHGILQNQVLLNEGFFDNLKLRAAYGQANNVPAYGSKFTGMVVSNIAGNPGVIVSTQEGQADIKPERQTEFETGIDFSVLKSRLSFELTYYNKTINDFLMLQNLPCFIRLYNKMGECRRPA